MASEGDAKVRYPHNGQPMGQVPFTGIWQLGPGAGGPGPGTSQQSIPAWQQALPQHWPVVPQPCGTLHGGVAHMPLAQ
jgi:hypothetical protein